MTHNKIKIEIAEKYQYAGKNGTEMLSVYIVVHYVCWKRYMCLYETVGNTLCIAFLLYILNY